MEYDKSNLQSSVDRNDLQDEKGPNEREHDQPQYHENSASKGKLLIIDENVLAQNNHQLENVPKLSEEKIPRHVHEKTIPNESQASEIDKKDHDAPDEQNIEYSEERPLHIALENKKETLLCEPCSLENETNPATHFCCDCEDPEPLCRPCAHQHLRQKSSRGHTLCDDIEKFQQNKCQAQMVHNVEVKENERNCGPCSFENLQNVATHFCETCQDHEPLCEMCAKQHLRQRSNRGHTLGKYSCIKDFNDQQTSCHQNPIDDKSSLLLSGNKIPGKPYASSVNSNSVALFWEKSLNTSNHYQIRYKSKGGVEKWKFQETEKNENRIIITGLKAKTAYIFQVRGVFEDEEGPYGPSNDSIVTTESMATTLIKHSTLISTDIPNKYQLPVRENLRARNTAARTRQLILGKPRMGYDDERTIMLVGATGSGKSTLVDGIANYVLGVNFEDPFRFSLVTLEKDEMKINNQAISQTEWITVYKIMPSEDSRLNYTLNIIDTPGFGDTRGLERDHGIIDQIRHLFSAQGEQGVLYIDAVCFIVKAPDARLTAVQKYIFSSIMSLFGKDIKSNICTLVTFADGAEPRVLASLKESKLPFGSIFQFNNSALFAENKNMLDSSLSQSFWDMGRCNFENFLTHINQFETKSLHQTKDVLEERERLKSVVSNIRPQISAGLSKLSELKEQLDILTKYKNTIKANQNFTYQVTETKQKKIDLPWDENVTNCINCNVTCHKRCRVEDNEKKRKCKVMDDDGYCNVCPDVCHWSDHKNASYRLKCVTETVTKTYADMKEKYEKAMGQTLSHEKYVQELSDDLDEKNIDIFNLIIEMNRCKNRLKEIALGPDPYSTVEHIDLLILSEEFDKQPGFENRIRSLQDLKKLALIDDDVQKFDDKLNITDKNIQDATGKSLRRRRMQSERKGHALSRGLQRTDDKLFQA
ncbi:uncharacterized protein LOC134241282 [Saccostrea cucullata]